MDATRARTPSAGWRSRPLVVLSVLLVASVAAQAALAVVTYRAVRNTSALAQEYRALHETMGQQASALGEQYREFTARTEKSLDRASASANEERVALRDTTETVLRQADKQAAAQQQEFAATVERYSAVFAEERGALRSSTAAIVKTVTERMAALEQEIASMVVRYAAEVRNEKVTIRQQSAALTASFELHKEALVTELKDLRKSVSDFVEKYSWLSARTALLDRTRRNASPTDVRELRARLDAVEASVRSQQRAAAEDRSSISDLLTRLGVEGPNDAGKAGPR